MVGIEPTHPKELIYSQPPLSNLAASPLKHKTFWGDYWELNPD